MKKNKYLLQLFLFVSLFVANAQDFDFQQLGNDIDGEAIDDKSGWSIALSADGSTVVIGAIRNDGNGDQSGQVRVYEKSMNVWTQIGDDIDGDALDNFLGDDVSISADGSIIAISATGNDANGMNSGLVRVYENLGGSWSQIGSDILGEAVGDQSGKSLSLSADGSIIAIGANYNDENAIDSGHVRIYGNQGGVWTQIGNDINGEAANDGSGRRISMSADGTIIAIGAPFNDGNGTNAGHVRIYENLIGVWTQIGSDIDGEAALDNSAWSLSLSHDGSIVAIGAKFNNDNGTKSGHVRIYRNVNQVWTKIGDDINGAAANDQSGFSVSLNENGTVVAIGATGNDDNGTNSGHVRVYKNLNDVWTQIGTDIKGEAAGDSFGYAVSLNADGTFLAIGAVNNDGNGSNSGHVRVYEFKPTLGVEDITLNSDYIIFYPNPSKHNIFFNEENQLEEVTLYSFEGKQLVTQNMQTAASLDISNLANGTYLLKIKTTKGVITKKLIKQ